ncbi:MAG: ACP phosphodiesterase [Bacteroidales bacterium]|nr:ACP phosphodiesterase [Bacteroidales bacterium]
MAHIYLSGDEELVKIGNFMGDYVKGKRYLNYRKPLQKGILLHRSIDGFTDHHKTPKMVKKLLRPRYHKYSGIVLDIFYDHFLTTNWHDFSNIPLNQFVEDFHNLLWDKFQILPAPVQSFVPTMIKRKRLLSYGEMEGVRKSLKIMSQYTSLPDETDYAMNILSDHYDIFSGNFFEFFPKLIEHVRKHYGIELCYSLNSNTPSSFKNN